MLVTATEIRVVFAVSDFSLDISSCTQNQNIKTEYNNYFSINLKADYLALGIFWRNEKKYEIS